MKYLVVCLLLAAESCLASSSWKNEYGRFYDNLADERESVYSLSQYETACQNSRARWHEILLACHGNVVFVGLLAVRIKRLIICKQSYNLHYSIQTLYFWTLSIVLLFIQSRFYLKTETESNFGNVRFYWVGFTWRRRQNPVSETLGFTWRRRQNPVSETLGFTWKRRQNPVSETLSLNKKRPVF
jgi:hypothetical protein